MAAYFVISVEVSLTQYVTVASAARSSDRMQKEQKKNEYSMYAAQSRAISDAPSKRKMNQQLFSAPATMHMSIMQSQCWWSVAWLCAAQM